MVGDLAFWSLCTSFPPLSSVCHVSSPLHVSTVCLVPMSFCLVKGPARTETSGPLHILLFEFWSFKSSTFLCLILKIKTVINCKINNKEGSDVSHNMSTDRDEMKVGKCEGEIVVTGPLPYTYSVLHPVQFFFLQPPYGIFHNKLYLGSTETQRLNMPHTCGMLPQRKTQLNALNISIFPWNMYKIIGIVKLPKQNTINLWRNPPLKHALYKSVSNREYKYVSRPLSGLSRYNYRGLVHSYIVPCGQLYLQNKYSIVVRWCNSITGTKKLICK